MIKRNSNNTFFYKNHYFKKEFVNNSHVCIIIKNNPYICSLIFSNDSVAQLVEQLTLNQRVQGSSPCGVTSKKKKGLYSIEYNPFFFCKEKSDLVMPDFTNR